MDQLSPDQRAELARDDQGPVTKSIVISFTVISFISVCVRLSTRFSYQNVGSEDYTIAISTVSSPLTWKEQEANSSHQIASVGMAACQVLRMVFQLYFVHTIY
jgi:hypothetical protein